MNLARIFSDAFPDRVAAVSGQRKTTFSQLSERSDRWRGALLESGLGQGSRVAILVGNDEVFLLAYLASVTAGMVAVPLNPQAPVRELRRQLDAVQVSAIVVGAAGMDVFVGLRDQLVADGVKCFVAEPIPAEATCLPVVLNAELDAGTPVPLVEVEGEDPALFLFTSGTAGDPKPAVLTHDNLVASMQSVRTANAEFLKNPQVSLAVIPLFHVFGINLLVNLALVAGTTMVLEDHVSSARTAELIREHEVTIVAGPPALWAGLVNDDRVTAADLSSIRQAAAGASRLEPSLAVQVNEMLEVDLNEGYGLTETGGVLSSGIGSNPPIGSVGILMPGVEARLVDLEGNNVLVGDVGEVWVRGPMLSPGYWMVGDDGTTSIETPSRTEDGWLCTGDLAVVDDDGYLAIMSRIKDLIIVSGFNVHPTEIEGALLSHPSVSQVGVRGEPDDATGERPVAFVVATPGHQFDADVLIAHCREELARYKVPTRIEPVLELPTNLIGKLRRQEL